MFQAENDPKRLQATVRAKPDSFTDCEDITPQIIPGPLEKKVNVDDDVTDYEFSKINTDKSPQGELFQDEMAKQVNHDDYKKDKQPFEDMPANNVASEDLPIRIKEVEMVVPNNIKHVKNTFDKVVSQFTIALQSPVRVKSEAISNTIPTDKADKIKPIDVEDNYFDATQDINKDQRQRSNVSLVVAPNGVDAVGLCSVDGNVKHEEDKTPTQILPALLENKVIVDDDVTDYEFAKINTNKPSQGELFLDEMTKQLINLDDYKKDKEPFKDMTADNVDSEDLEKVVPNNIKHVKNTFDEIVNQLTIALQSAIGVLSEDIPNAAQDINKDQREKPNLSLALVIASNENDEVMLSSVDGHVQNKQNENENTFCRSDMPSRENMDVLSGNDATLTVSDSLHEESTPKKSNRFTYMDSDLPEDSEIRDILMSYPKPTVEELFSESESESSSEDESYEFSRRFRNKTEPVTKIDLTRMIGVEKLPSRVMTRLRKFKPNYLKQQEPHMDEDIINENIKWFKSFKKVKNTKDFKNNVSIEDEKKETTSRKKTDNKSNAHKRKVKVKIEKPQRKGKKSTTKSFARKNKGDSLELNSISAVKTTTRRTRSMKKENEGKNTQNKCIFLGNKNKKPNHKPYKKERAIFPERRSKRQQKTKEKNGGTIKVPITLLRKSMPKQSTVYNVSSSSFESLRSLKRSLVDDIDVSTPMRTRSHSNNNNNSINHISLRATRVVKTPRVLRTAFPDKEHKQDKLCLPELYVHLVRYVPAQERTLNSNRNYTTRSQLARKISSSVQTNQPGS